MSPHYDRHSDSSGAPVAQRASGGPDGAAMEVAAEALRQAEVEAVQTEVSSIDSTQLEGLSIDELRAIAAELDVPNRGQIVEQDELIAAIRQRM